MIRMIPRSFKVTEDRRGWHLDKGIPVSTIVTMLVLIVSILIWFLTLEKRVEINAMVIEEVKRDQEKLIEKTDKYHEDYLRELRQVSRDIKRIKDD